MNLSLHQATYLKNVERFRDEDITILMDVGGHTMPTADNILKALKEFASSAQPGDALYCHYAGHGGQVPDISGDEADGYDECLYATGFNTIVDDEIFTHLVAPLPAGVTLTCVMDCCHSGMWLSMCITICRLCPIGFSLTPSDVVRQALFLTCRSSTLRMDMTRKCT